MAAVQERRKHTRPLQAVGTTSHHAQARVDARVMEIMGRRDLAERRASHPDAPADLWGRTSTAPTRAERAVTLAAAAAGRGQTAV
jgi:hypothetical protein